MNCAERDTEGDRTEARVDVTLTEMGMQYIYIYIGSDQYTNITTFFD